tara:strand:- start:480 stop:632 length:153 start_codon:yes stop_codon:yes gene_type:complete
MINHFMEFTIPELVDAYAYFTDNHDYMGCALIAEAFTNKTSFNLVNFKIQ